MEVALDFGAVIENMPALLTGALRAVLYAVSGYGIGVAVAMLVIVGRMAWGRPFEIATQVFVEVIRNTPFLLQAFFLFFGLASLGFMVPAYVAAIIIVTVNSTAYAIEILRAGTLNINKGMLEAGDALGFTPFQQFRYVIMRPMLRACLPSLSGQFIIILLNTSLLSAIAVSELNYEASNLAASSFRPFEVYLTIAAFYLIISSAFAGLFAILTKRVTGQWGVERGAQAVL